MLYLLKIRHGPAFGRRGHALWRVLFVKALMPWMFKYRTQTATHGMDGEEEDPYHEENRDYLAREYALQQENAELRREVDRLRRELNSSTD